MSIADPKHGGTWNLQGFLQCAVGCTKKALVICQVEWSLELRIVLNVLCTCEVEDSRKGHFRTTESLQVWPADEGLCRRLKYSDFDTNAELVRSLDLTTHLLTHRKVYMIAPRRQTQGRRQGVGQRIHPMHSTGVKLGMSIGHFHGSTYGIGRACHQRTRRSRVAGATCAGSKRDSKGRRQRAGTTLLAKMTSSSWSLSQWPPLSSTQQCPCSCSVRWQTSLDIDIVSKGFQIRPLRKSCRHGLCL